LSIVNNEQPLSDSTQSDSQKQFFPSEEASQMMMMNHKCCSTSSSSNPFAQHQYSKNMSFSALTSSSSRASNPGLLC
jgi:hypothetical protein